MIDPVTIRKHLEEILAENGCFLVELRVDRNNRIRIRLDSDEGIDIDDCASVSRMLESKLDRNREDFELEVSSPGLDSDFKVIEQYHKSLGKEIRVISKDGRTAEGKLSRVDGDGIRMDGPVTVSMKFSEIKSARRIIRL